VSSQPAFQVAEGFRLSPQQRRLWRLRESHSEQAFGTQCVVTITGALDAGHLSHAVTKVTARYEILRTSFGFLADTSVPVQIVDGVAPRLESTIELRGMDVQRQESEVQLILEKQLERLRSLAIPPAISFALIRLADARQLFIVTASALCADLPALFNIVREIQVAYSDPSTGDSEVLQYADLSEWQNQLLEHPTDQNHVPYWKSEDLTSPCPRLPFELRKEEVSNRKVYETIELTVSKETWAAIGSLTHRLEVSTQSVLLAAWQHLLKNLSNTDTFLIGAELDGRLQDELQTAIGVFTKYLPLNLRCNARVCDFIQQTHMALEIARHDQLQFDWSAGISGAADQDLLYSVIFASRELPLLEMTDSLTWEFRSIFEHLEPFELSLNVVTTTARLQLQFSWDSAIYARADVGLLARSYTALLQEMAEHADGLADELTVNGISDAMCMPSIQVPEAIWPALDELIAAQVMRVPQETAVICEDQRITYAELDRHSSALAAMLEQAGAGPDKVIALVAERSIQFVVGMLAIVKAGAAWLPIEPDLPQERADYMMKQSQAVAVLTQQTLPQQIAYGELPVIFLDDPNIFEVARTNSVRRQFPPNRLAYVIFTSGSTGRPKGVSIEHRQVASYVHALLERVHPQTSSDFAVVSTVAADLGHTSIFAALSRGGCLHMIPARCTVDLEALAQYFLTHPVHFVKIVPAHLEALCRSLPESVQLPWRQLLVGGELLTPNVVELVKRFAPECEVFNHYGPTETTVGVFCGMAAPSLERFACSSIPIGRPFAGVASYLLSSNMQPVPVWAPGELYIGGSSVGRGYVGEGALTADRFLPDPFHPVPGSRMYRTGDMVRYRSDGLVEFLGRRDGQIKIRGYRVEVGEIEAVLSHYPNVRNAAVVVREDKLTGKYLQAFVAIGAAKITAEELRHYLDKALPHYMVPAGIFCVDHLKLTANGKVDRQALPAKMESSSPATMGEPRNDVEESLVAVFRKVLGVERVSVNDNYFSLGGDSLRVIQVVHEARRYGITIGAADVLRHQTVRKLSYALQERVLSGLFPNGIPTLPLPSPEMLQRLPADVADAYPLSGIQTFIIEKYRQDHQRKGVYHVQESIHVSDVGLSMKDLEAAFRLVIERHPALRTVVDLASLPPMQWVRHNLQWKLHVEDISHLSVVEQEAHITEALTADRGRPFDLSDRESPLFRASVFLRSSSDFNWVFSCHHAIIDGWGHRVLLNQFVQTYLAIKAGRKVELGKPDCACHEFVAYQEAVRKSEKAAEFWKQYLNDIDIPSLLQTGHAEPVSPEEARVVHALEPSLVEALSQAARARAVSMQALILSAWFESLRTLAGRELVTTGVITNGRSEHLSDPLSAIGLFWNIVPVVSRHALPVLEQVNTVHKDLIDIEPYSAYPLPQISADHGRKDLFFSSFRFLNFWNLQQLPAESGLRLLGLRAYDRYSFPLNCTASLNPLASGGLLQIEYDPEMFMAGTVQALLDNFAVLLENAASSIIQAQS
jgi:amino acid adenylation domain-containing protein